MPFGFIQDAQRVLRRVYPPAAKEIDNATSRVFDVNRTLAGWADANPYEDPQRSYSWEVKFRNPFNDDNSTLKFYAKATGIPTDTNEVIKRYYAGVPYNISGKETSPKIFRVTLWDNQDLEAFRFFQRWFQVMNDTDLSRKVTPETYYQDIVLTLQDNSHTYATGEFVMTDCFPSEISETPLAYNESTDMTFDVMFSFNRKIML